MNIIEEFIKEFRGRYCRVQHNCPMQLSHRTWDNYAIHGRISGRILKEYLKESQEKCPKESLMEALEKSQKESLTKSREEFREESRNESLKKFQESVKTGVFRLFCLELHFLEVNCFVLFFLLFMVL